MKSKWFESKTKAIELRKEGKSLKDIEKSLGIPRSTLSGWFRGIELTKSQKKKLDLRWRRALVVAREKSVLWHNAQKIKRLKHAESEAEVVLKRVGTSGDTLDLALAMLYLGEGFKKGTTTGVGNSDPLILKFFVEGIVKNYGFDRKMIRCELHLRADQDDKEMKDYWSQELGISKSNFGTTSFDKRTLGKKTYKDYKGVCVIKFGTVAIQRKLVYLSRQFCERIIKGD